MVTLNMWGGTGRKVAEGPILIKEQAEEDVVKERGERHSLITC